MRREGLSTDTIYGKDIFYEDPRYTVSSFICAKSHCICGTDMDIFGGICTHFS